MLRNDNNFKVIARLRLPQDEEELSSVLDLSSNHIILSPVLNNKMFQFDQVYSQTSTQSEIFYSSVENMLSKFFMCFNFTIFIFAYGQTNSGKSYTLGTISEFD
jgi:hypothetical protein